MNPLFLFLFCSTLGAALLAALVWIIHLRRSLRKIQKKNQHLQHVLLLGSHTAQEDLNAMRKLRHDLRHYLRMTDTATLSEDASEALNRALEHPLAAEGTQSWTLSTLERYYRSQGEALGFQTDIDLNSMLPQEQLIPDLCLVVSNLLENAVEALQREGGGWMRARSMSAPGYFSLVVSNSCSHPLRTRNGRYLSSKAEGRVGLGLSTVQEIARQYGGLTEFSADGTQFRAFVFLPCPIHPLSCVSHPKQPQAEVPSKINS